MRKLYILIFISLLMGCSSAANAVDQKKDVPQEQSKSGNQQNNTEAAKQYFIDGSVSEMKGNYAEAILDYQQALKYDSSAGIHYAIAKNYLRLNKLDLAKEHAEEAAKKDYFNSEYKYLVATIFQASRNLDSAVVIYNEIIGQDSTQTQAYFNLANIYKSTNPQEARKLYNKLLIINGPDWNVLISLAQVNEMLGDNDKTVATVEKLVKIDPSNLKLKKLLIESYIKNQQYGKAIVLAEDLLVEYPDDINLQEYKANALVQSGDWEEGSKEYLKLVNSEQIPFESKIQIGAAFLAHAQIDTNSLKKAENIFNSIKEDTTAWQLDLSFGEIALERNQDSVAVKYFESAADSASWNSQIFMRLGGLLFDMGKYQEAIDRLSPVIDDFSEEYSLNLILGLSYAQMNNSKQAEKYLKKAVMLNPDDLNALFSYGVNLSMLKKYDEALIYLKKALELDPQNYQIMSSMGLIYDNQGKFEEAQTSYEKALELNPTDPLILNNYAYALSEQGIELERAHEMSKQAIEAAPENASYLDTYGWIQYMMGNYEDAKSYIEKSLEFEPDNGEVFYHLGDVYEKLGDSEKALENWKKAYEIDPDQSGLKEKIEGGK